MADICKLVVFVLHISLVCCRVLENIRDIENNAIENDAIPIDLQNIEEIMFGIPSPETGKLVTEWNENSEENPEELGEYVEGDILFPNDFSKNGMRAESFRWTNGVIPFEIKGNFNAHEMDTIETALNLYHNNTCIRFKPRVGKESHWIRITSDSTGCWSSVGRVQKQGAQQLNLQSPGCLKRVGTVVHELMHVVGFLHEQNRPERDDFVDIAFWNIKYGHEHNFDKAKKSTVNDFGVPYDYKSVMHYSSKAFSRNGKATIIPKVKSAEIGQRKGFSKADIEKINRMYNCTV